MTSSAKNKNVTKKNLKDLGDGFPWIFTEPKNCYLWFPMNSGHRTEKLFSIGIEILGLGIRYIAVLNT